MERQTFCEHKVSFKRGGFESREKAEEAAETLIMKVGHSGFANFSKTKDGVECIITLICDTSNPDRCLVRKLKSLKNLNCSPDIDHGCLLKDE